MRVVYRLKSPAVSHTLDAATEVLRHDHAKRARLLTPKD